MTDKNRALALDVSLLMKADPSDIDRLWRDAGCLVLLSPSGVEASARQLGAGPVRREGPLWMIAGNGKNVVQWCDGAWLATSLSAGTLGASLAGWLESTGRSKDSIAVASTNLELQRSRWNSIVPAPEDLQDAVSRTRMWEARQDDAAAGRIYFSNLPGLGGVIEGATWFDAIAVRHRNTTARPSLQGAMSTTFDETMFRIWAPRCKQVDVLTSSENDRSIVMYPLERDADGYHHGFVPVGPGADYQLVLDRERRRPDPSARFQPTTVHGASRVVATNSFPWSDHEWRGVNKRDLVIYELHLGTFSEQGGYRGALERLPYLKSLGVTAIELLPLAQAPGRWNWGYDGVAIYAPNHNYGTTDELKQLVDACHQQGIAVLLDVVYNHFGPEGNYLSEYGPYFSRRHHTPWGDAVNYDSRQSRHVRQWVIENAVYWLEEFHLDGLRLDAVHFMFDDSELTILQEMRQATSEFARATHRTVHMIAEANMFDEQLLAPEAGDPYDAIWCDCLMHAIYSLGAPSVRMTHREFNGSGDIAEALEHGYLYRGPKAHRVTAEEKRLLHDTGRDYVRSLVIALQTHDSVGNHPHGKRIHQLTSLAFQQAAAAIVLLYPAIPMIFMGEESAANAPFPFFADFGDSTLRKRVDEGRAREYPQHEWKGAVAPSDPAAFYSAKCDLQGPSHPAMLAWYQQLLRLRRNGLAEGWLDVERMTVDANADRQVFRLTFETEDPSTAIEVIACLGDKAEPGVVVEGRILLDSRQPEHQSSLENRRVALQPNHAIVAQLSPANETLAANETPT